MSDSRLSDPLVSDLRLCDSRLSDASCLTRVSPPRQARPAIPAVAHQRVTAVSVPAYSSPLMPYLLMDEDDVVVLPRRRTLARLSDELDDDPVLKVS